MYPVPMEEIIICASAICAVRDDDDVVVQDLDCCMLEDTSRTCRLDDLLCLLMNQSQLMLNTPHRHLPAWSSTLQLFAKTHDHLMLADGPLSHQHRHYIALLVSRLRFLYLITRGARLLHCTLRVASAQTRPVRCRAMQMRGFSITDVPIALRWS